MQVVCFISQIVSVYYTYTQMGGGDSKAEDYFLLEHLSKLTLRNTKPVSYYLIQPHKDSSLQQTLSLLRKYFKVDYFPQIKTLKQQMSFVGTNQIVKVIASCQLWEEDIEYLQSEEKINQIVQFGDGNDHRQKYSKIKGYVQGRDDLLKVLTELESKDTAQVASNNLLFIDQDTKLLNKYRLNFQCNIAFKGREQAKLDFIIAARHLFPAQKEAIDDFQKNYDISKQGPEKSEMVTQWIFKNNFYWELASVLPKTTTDPKRLAYVRLALKDIFDTIRLQHKRMNREFFIVTEVSAEEKAKIEKAEKAMHEKGQKQKKFILFSGFIKGFLNQKEALSMVKGKPHMYMFNVEQFTGMKADQLDFGYLVRKDGKSGEVFYNIYNVFRIDSVNSKTQKGTLSYGALANLRKRRDTFSEQLQAKPIQGQKEEGRPSCEGELDLLRNYDYLQDQLTKMDSQAMILQLSGYHQQSLEVFDRKINDIRKTNESDQEIQKCVLHKADALRIGGELQQAEQEYRSGAFLSEKMKLISKIHLGDLYLQLGNDDKFYAILDQIEPKLETLRKDEREEYFKGRNFVVLKMMKKGSMKNADKELSQLVIEIGQAYPNSYEGKSLVHDIYRSHATCKSKLGKHGEALAMLKSTLTWQLVCEGMTANVAMTETLIQSVASTSGNKEQLAQSEQRMAAMSQQMDPVQRRFGSTIGAGLQQSMINLNLST